MKQLFLTTSVLFLISVGCNTQTISNEGYCSISLNDLHSLPTETEWKAAAKAKKKSTSESNPHGQVLSLDNLHSLPTEAEWKRAATFGKRLDAN